MEGARTWRVWMGLSIYCTRDELDMVKDYMAQEEERSVRAVRMPADFMGSNMRNCKR